MYYDACIHADVWSDWVFNFVFALGRRSGRGDSHFHCGEDVGEVSGAGWEAHSRVARLRVERVTCCVLRVASSAEYGYWDVFEQLL